jgi:phosphohistidine phosphatase
VILYFLRHGDAGQPRATDDDARELTSKGRERLKAAAVLWRRLKVRPQIVISSPLPRALQTAELAMRGLDQKGSPTIDDGLRPGATWRAMAAALATARKEVPGTGSAMLVGHEPDLSAAIGFLTGATSVALRKGAIGAVEVDGEPRKASGRLLWLLDPDLYRG